MTEPFEQVKKDILLTHRVIRESNIGGIECLFIETRLYPSTTSLIYYALGEYFHTNDWEVKEDLNVGRYLELPGEGGRSYKEWKRLNSL